MATESVTNIIQFPRPAARTEERTEERPPAQRRVLELLKKEGMSEARATEFVDKILAKAKAAQGVDHG